MSEEILTKHEQLVIFALLANSGPLDAERHEIVQSALRKIDGATLIARKPAKCPISGTRHHWRHGTGNCIWCDKPKPGAQ